MGEEQTRYIAQLGDQVNALAQNVSEHRHWRDPQWDLWTRCINRTGRTTWDDHFRSGNIPAGFAWLGAPFGGAPGGAGGILDYSYQGTYLRVTPDAQPHFLSRAVGSYINKFFIARCETGNGGFIGIRADDGTNNNYVEFYLESLNNNTARLVFSFVTGGGAPTTNASPGVRSDYPMAMLLYFNNAVPGFVGYMGKESGRWDADNNHQTGVIAWVPTRIGLIFRNNASFSTMCDFISNEYV